MSDLQNWELVERKENAPIDLQTGRICEGYLYHFTFNGELNGREIQYAVYQCVQEDAISTFAKEHGWDRPLPDDLSDEQWQEIDKGVSMRSQQAVCDLIEEGRFEDRMELPAIKGGI